MTRRHQSLLPPQAETIGARTRPLAQEIQDVFISWKSDHPPRHVHVYRNGKLVVKWDLDNKKPMMGAVSRKLLDLIRDLER